MAQRVQIILEDDFDGGVADSTVKFSLGTEEYEIDLSKENATKMADALGPWIAHARRLGRGKRKSTAAAKSAGSSNTSDIRAWAQETGLEVSSRGRVSAEIREAYEKANS